MAAPEVSNDSPVSGYPSQERPNSRKDRKYIIAQIKAMHRQTVQWATTFSVGYDDNTGKVPPIWGMYPRARDTRLQTRGLGDVEMHKKVWSLVSKEANGILTGRDMRWDMPRDHVPYFDRLRNIFSDRDTSITVRVLNKASQDAHLMSQMMELAGASMNTDPMLSGAAKSMGVDLKPPSTSPQTPGEWEIFSKLGGKMAIAVAVRRALEAVKEINRYMTEIRPRLSDAIIDDGVLVITSRRGNMGIPIIDVIPFEMCSIPRTNNNWRDLPRFGYWKWMTPSQIFAEMGEECTPQIRKRILALAQTNLNQSYPLGYTGLRPIDANTTEAGIKVFVGMFKDFNELVVAERKSDGLARQYHEWGEDELDPAKYDIRRTTYEVCYEGCFIPGTEDGPDGKVDHENGIGCIYWGCGMSYSQARMRGSLRGSRLPVVISAYNMTDMTLESLGTRMMAQYYNVVRASLELRALLLHIIPPTTYIEEEWLDRVTSHTGAGQAKRTDIIRAARQSGVMVINSRDPEDSNDMGRRGFEKGIQVEEAMIPEFERLSNLIAVEMDRFEKAGGFNQANSGETIDERAAARNVIQMAQSQAKALKPMMDCLDDAEGRLCEILYAQLQATLAQGGEMEWMAPFLGDATAGMVRLTADNDPMNVGISMRQMSTEEERHAFEELLAGAVTNGEISADEAFWVKGMEDKNDAAAMLMLLRERREATAHERQMEAVNAQTAGNQQIVQMNSEAMMAKVQAESQARMAEIELKAAKEAEKLQIQHSLDMEKLVLTMEGTMQREFAKMDAKMQETMDKIASQERISANSDGTKREIADGVNETHLEVASMTTEAQKEVAKSRPATPKSK